MNRAYYEDGFQKAATAFCVNGALCYYCGLQMPQALERSNVRFSTGVEGTICKTCHTRARVEALSKDIEILPEWRLRFQD